MQIIIDTREGENPKTGLLTFEPKYTHYRRDKYYNILSEEVEEITTVEEKLDVGDYRGRWSNGKESKVIIERKSIGDLWGTLSDRKRTDRFREEIKRAKQADISLIICIEGTYGKIKKGFKYSKRPSSEITNQLRTIWAKYGVTHHYCVDRGQMSEFIVDTFIWCGKKKLWV